MKKDFLMSVIVAIILVFAVKTYYEKKLTITLKLQQKRKFQMETKMKC
ncbi:hypothetical protein LC564_07150 [Fusobacterium animalis]|nr:hypothetical protein [Fusobacterium sp. CM1]